MNKEELLSLLEEQIAKAKASNTDYFPVPIGEKDDDVYEGDAGKACAKILNNLWNNQSNGIGFLSKDSLQHLSPSTGCSFQTRGIPEGWVAIFILRICSCTS